MSSWLLESDPAIRWQVLRDLTDAGADEVTAARAEVTQVGWGAQLLAARDENGIWAGGGCFPADFAWGSGAAQPWTATLPSLTLLRDVGVSPDAAPVVEAIAAVRDHARWEHAGQPFFDGEVEPCINGRTVAVGAYFGVPVDGIVDRLLDEQLDDGGWNCEAENGSTRSSFHSTICVLEGLLEHERTLPDAPQRARIAATRTRGEEYLLQRRLFRRLSIGAVIDPEWLEFAFPTWWHYDVLRGLDYFRDAAQASGALRGNDRSGAGRPDARLSEAIDDLRRKQQPDGRWQLDHLHPGAMHFTMETVGEPSRWNTLRAARVLRWWDAAA